MSFNWEGKGKERKRKYKEKGKGGKDFFLPVIYFSLFLLSMILIFVVYSNVFLFPLPIASCSFVIALISPCLLVLLNLTRWIPSAFGQSDWNGYHKGNPARVGGGNGPAAGNGNGADHMRSSHMR